MAQNTDKTLMHKLIYSVFVRNHTPEGTFRALEGDLDRLRALGTDIVWLMPIHPIGKEGRKGTLGSPYAIRDYRGINPEYGTMEDFRHLVDAIHDRGMKCIIDVVYNHTSPDSVLAHTHPEWFFHDEQGRPSRHVADWWDVVDLDYGNRELWRYQIDTLKMWAEMVDGFRCDVASSVPLDFWTAARQEVETVRPGCIWLAESVHGLHVLGLRKMGAYCATDTELYRAFDMTYDYDIWPWFEGCLTGRNTLQQYIDMLNYQELTYPSGFIKMRCGENHDTPRLAQLGAGGAPPAALAGVPVLLSGQHAAVRRHGVRTAASGGAVRRRGQFRRQASRLTGIPAPLQGHENVPAAGRRGVVRGQRRRCYRALQVPGRGAHRRV